MIKLGCREHRTRVWLPLIEIDTMILTSFIYKEAKLANWETRTRIALNRLMFKFKFHSGSVDSRNIQTRLHEGRVFQMDRRNTTRFFCSLSYKIRSGWNGLPTCLRCIEDYSHFKISIKNQYTRLYFKGNNGTVNGVEDHLTVSWHVFLIPTPWWCEGFINLVNLIKQGKTMWK